MKRNLSPLQPLYLRKEENIYILYYIIYIIKRKIYKKKKFGFFRIDPTLLSPRKK